MNEEQPMTLLTIDASTLARLKNLSEMLEFRDESGRLLGYFHPAGATAASFPSPFSDEELQILRQQRTGRPLKDILEQLGPT
jgi:hypothetical protein